MRRRDFVWSTAAAAMMLRADEAAKPLFDGRSLQGWHIVNGPETAFYVDHGEIVIDQNSNYPCYLRTNETFENFVLNYDVFIKGWANSGIYFAAPEFGPPLYCGYKINIFQNNEGGLKPTSMGSIFPVVAPVKAAVKPGEWNAMSIRFEWPRIRVLLNGETVQDLDVTTVPELKWRLRRGHIGIESLSYPVRYRNITIKRLPSNDPSQALYEQPSDFDNWRIAEPGASWDRIGNILRADGLGYLSTKEKLQDFYLEMYVRQSKFSNGGVYFRTAGDDSQGDHYEIQLHDVEGANYATGSLYGIERAKYPRIEPEQWYLFQMVAQGTHCLVRINGETVVDCMKLTREVPGYLMLQAHQKGRWIEYRSIRLTKL